MKYVFLFSLLLVAVAAAPFEKLNEISFNDFEDDDFLELEILDNDDRELIEFLPDETREKIIQNLRLKAISFKVKLINLIASIDEKKDEVEHKILNTKNPIFKAKLNIQLKTLEALRKSCFSAKEKFDKYFVSEKSEVIKTLVLTIERFIERKFSTLTFIIKETYNIYKAFHDADKIDNKN